MVFFFLAITSFSLHALTCRGPCQVEIYFSSVIGYASEGLEAFSGFKGFSHFFRALPVAQDPLPNLLILCGTMARLSSILKNFPYFLFFRRLFF